MLVRCEGASWGEGGRRSVVDSNNVELKLVQRPCRRFKLVFQMADQDRRSVDVSSGIEKPWV